ncbi:MAG: carbonate dehydratase [Chloracidobacterium sp.]|nr:carbonate dehydratase [Chloracidobacterium sp.]
MSNIEHLLANNKQWAERSREQDPRFFTRLADQQNPDYLWIGCSDSRVSANVIVDLAPGEVFVHRNVANLVNHTDMNCLSVIQFAVEVLQVEHIIVCGHYGCGGIVAAMDSERHGLIDNWLRHIRDTANLHADRLEAICDPTERNNKLCELNVAEQVVNVGETTIVLDAWERAQPLSIHGWVYSLADGLIRDLDISIESEAELRGLRNRFLFTDKRPNADGASK